MGWNSLDLPGARIETVDTELIFPLGTRCTARDTTNEGVGQFVYMAGVASVVAGSWCLLNYDDGAVTLLADGDAGGVGVAMSAVDAATSYGWFQTCGKGSAYLGANSADNALLYTTTTAGMADDAASGQTEIMGARGASLVGGAAANGDVELNHPTVTSVQGA